MEFTILESDTRCDEMDAVLKLHPKMSVKLQNTMSNLIDLTAQAQLRHTLDEVVKWLQENGAVLNGVFCLQPEKWQELKEAAKAK